MSVEQVVWNVLDDSGAVSDTANPKSLNRQGFPPRNPFASALR
jgi:hypothetical protein